MTSVQVGHMVVFLSQSRLLNLAALESASWLGPALAQAVHICKVNASAGLSARPTMSFYPVAFSFRLLEVGARVDSYAASLLDLGVLEALDYACANDFATQGSSVSSDAAGAAVMLMGRNEGGKTLSRMAVDAVLDDVSNYFDPSHARGGYPCAKAIPSVHRVATMAIADANKKIMLQHDKLLDKLLGIVIAGLVLDDDNPRRGQDGADALQEMCAGVLHELALYGP
eukprot:COSAG04_NODE_4136_length_2276_cov_18.885622_1_plen_226_part_10